jgi:hypothetical protein
MVSHGYLNDISRVSQWHLIVYGNEKRMRGDLESNERNLRKA